MDAFVQTPLIHNMIQIGMLVLGLAVVWIIIRFVLRLAWRLLFTGCALILALGLVLFLIRAFGS
jgi:hypothetical protein